MRTRWGQVFAVVAAVLVAGLVTVLLVANTEAGPGTRQATETPDRTMAWIATATAEPRPSSLGTATSPPRITVPKRPLTVDTGCRIGQGPQRLADVPQSVTNRVNRAWERIEKWLAANAPRTAASLQPPATTDQISWMQRQIGVPIPPELITTLLRHNGTSHKIGRGAVLPPFYQPMSIDWIMNDAKMMCELLAGGDDVGVGSWWHGQVIPIAADGGGGHLLLDQRPGHNGRLGDRDEETDMGFDRYPPTLTDLLERTATAMETGGLVMKSYRPKVVEDGVLDWDIV